MSELPTIIVPARLESTRLKQKLMHEIEGKPLIIWTAERIKKEASKLRLYFAVDDRVLSECLSSYGFESVMTRKEHTSGTDRLAEANEKIGAKWVINVQGDEPLIQGEQIQLIASNLLKSESMVTLATPFRSVEDFNNPNHVKVVCNEKGEALYFSRSPIPYVRDFKGSITEEWLVANDCYRHIGLYGYSAEFLKQFVLSKKGFLENAEKLEQLRVLEHGHQILVGISKNGTIGIDTIEDLEVFKAHLTC
tara:strand:+ start:2996 stop:3745 length:750 start_codon:yes stop_codon:yes gene_type:complete